MVKAHCADAMVCISNCDKITPGMLMAALRLNIPVIFVSGGPMEAGKTKLASHGLDLVDAMVIAADSSASDEKVAEYERDRKSVVSGKSVSVRVDLGGRRIIKKKKTETLKEVGRQSKPIT